MRVAFQGTQLMNIDQQCQAGTNNTMPLIRLFGGASF